MTNRRRANTASFGLQFELSGLIGGLGQVFPQLRRLGQVPGEGHLL